MQCSLILISHVMLWYSTLVTPVFSYTVHVEEILTDENRLGGTGKSYVEHRVTREDAEKAAMLLQPTLMVGTGCKNCSKREMLYCMSEDVIQDHCCCDRKFHEAFPYVEHTCFVRERLCSTVVPNCGEYARIQNCCCHQYLGAKWKQKTSSAPWFKSWELSILPAVLSTLRLCQHI
uniref:CCC domain-containing protein n=1 Tax=Cacopsylla melanoneura TaxID=428564 RepID=A0A8D9BJR3_9HEMI